MIKVGLFIPTYNAGENFGKILDNIDLSIRDSKLDVKKIIIDTFSTDRTSQIAINHGFDVYKIHKRDFTHGEVRRRAVEYLNDCEYIIFMTQDVVLHRTSIEEIVRLIVGHKNMVVAYGKQEPDRLKADILEQQSRRFNYPDTSYIKTKKDIPNLGIKTVFSSDAFSIYRRNLLIKVGSFPAAIKYCEDMYVAAKAIEHGYEVGYCASSVVTHSNKMNLKQQFSRYKSIGEFHRQNPWIQKEFGSNESEGIRLIFSEWKFLIKKNKAYLIPYSIFIKMVKFVAYKA